jgi:hypothetical protein
LERSSFFGGGVLPGAVTAILRRAYKAVVLVHLEAEVAGAAQRPTENMSSYDSTCARCPWRASYQEGEFACRSYGRSRGRFLRSR